MSMYAFVWNCECVCEHAYDCIDHAFVCVCTDVCIRMCVHCCVTSCACVSFCVMHPCVRGTAVECDCVGVSVGNVRDMGV